MPGVALRQCNNAPVRCNALRRYQEAPPHGLLGMCHALPSQDVVEGTLQEPDGLRRYSPGSKAGVSNEPCAPAFPNAAPKHACQRARGLARATPAPLHGTIT